MGPFAFTTLLSAFLLFQIQPLIARVILPSFGGTPGVWTTCMLFFQSLLVGGYGYGHVVATRLSPRRQARVHTVAVGLAIAALVIATLRWGSPLVPPESYRPDASHAPVFEMLRLLLITVGVPYLVLSTTGPLVQSWSRLADPSRSPYRLYSLSNIGSLAGLLLYPTLVEPLFGLHGQAWLFTSLFAAFGASVLWCGRLAAKVPEANVVPKTTPADGEPPRFSRYLVWAGLAAAASTLLLSVTNQLCQDVAAIPLLWVVPLSLYLISFILAFDERGGRSPWYARWLWMPMYACAAALAVYLLPRTTLRVGFQIPAWSALLLSGCMVCHGELSRSRPLSRYLTGFWFSVSVGGAIGGLFVSLIAPRIMKGYFEVHVAIFACALALVATLWGDKQSPLHKGSRVWSVPALMIVMLDLAWVASRHVPKHLEVLYLGAAFVGVFLGVLLALRPKGASLGGDDPFWLRLGLPMALLALGVSLGAHIRSANRDTVAVSRSFFGVLRVEEEDADDPKMYRRMLTHGRIVHGFELLQPAGPHTPCSYYEPNSGVGRAIRLHPKRATGLSLGMCGLGTGTIASYTQSGDTLRFYEIDPDVVALSSGEHPWFHYLQKAFGKVDITLGDARVSLKRELEEHGPHGFDVLAVDAFSGDAIPVHLLTKEAVALYMQHLAPGGVLALHISNRHIQLFPVVKAIAEALSLKWKLVDTSYDDDDYIHWDSSWVLVGRDDATLAPYGASDDPGKVPTVPPFTDDFSNIMKLLKL
jgi:hypothetical protein